MSEHVIAETVLVLRAILDRLGAEEPPEGLHPADLARRVDREISRLERFIPASPAETEG